MASIVDRPAVKPDCTSQLYIVEKSLPDLGNSVALGLQRGVNSISLQCIPWTVGCSEWGACDRFLISDFGGKWPLKWKFSKMSFRIPWRDAEIRFVNKFGGNRPLQSCQKVIWFTTQKTSLSMGLVSAPILPKMGRSCPKLPERCHPLICPRIPNLVLIGCVCRTYFGKIDFSAQKVITIKDFEPTTRSSAVADRPRDTPCRWQLC